MLEGNVLITGGAGTLGKAIIGRAVKEGWNCKFTIFSRDAAKHALVKAMYPGVRCVHGDIRDATTLYNVMSGHETVIHAAAVKRIPESEWNSIDTYEINVGGSLNVAQCAVQLEIPRVIAISTDKACHPANAYGATKYLMEKIWQEHARLNLPTQFHLVRYGNILESTGSVIEAWKNAAAAGKPIRITNLDMTRFWLSPSRAVDLVLGAFKLQSGHVYVAKMSALSIGKLALYCSGEMTHEQDVRNFENDMIGNNRVEYVPMRPGEKMHETLLTVEELEFADDHQDYFDLRPTTEPRTKPIRTRPYSSDNAPELTERQLYALLEEA